MSEEFVKYLLYGMGTAIVALSGACLKLFNIYRKQLEERIKRAESMKAYLEGIEDELKRSNEE